MRQLSLELADLDAILISHEHCDHVSGLSYLMQQTGLIPHMSRGTALSLALPMADHHPLRADELTIVNNCIEVRPFAVPHDAREPIQFTFVASGAKLGFLADAGSISSCIIENLSDCNALVLECNYDEDMLARNPAYPPILKNRIRGRHGHLSNDQVVACLHEIAHPDLRYIVAAHLSENNNREELVRKSLQQCLAKVSLAPQLTFAHQHSPSSWIEVPAPPAAARAGS